MEWHLQPWALSALKPNEDNPRSISEVEYAQLERNIQKFGLIDKPVVNADGAVIGGHQRLKLLEEHGHAAIDCWTPTDLLSKEDVDELCIRLNANHGDFDVDILANVYDIDNLIEWGIGEDLLGLEKAEKSKKEAKPQVIFEFTDRDALIEWLPRLETFQGEASCKMKVKG